MSEQELQPFTLGNLTNKLVQNKKRLVTFCISLLIAFLITAGSFLFLEGAAAKVVPIAAFLALGVMHSSVLQRSLSELTAIEKLFYTLFLAFVILVLLSVFYLFSGNFNLLAIAAAACAFLLFYVVEMLWQFYNTLAYRPVSPWYYSKDLLLDQATVFLNSIPIRLKVQLEESHRKEYVFNTRAPVKMKLGLIFYHMIQEQNANGKIPVNFTDNNQSAEGWIFFTPRISGWNKILNPEASLVTNGIKQDTVIIARQIKEQSVLPSPSLQKELPN